MKSIFLTCTFFLLLFKISSQDLDANNRVTVALRNGVKVNLVGKAMPKGSKQASTEFYYLPTNLKLAKKADGVTPEFLFVKYTTEKDAAAGGVQGAIIHFLIEWGLNDAERKEAEMALKDLLKKKPDQPGQLMPARPLRYQTNEDSKIKILGPVDLLSNEGSFEIYSASLSDAKLIKSGKAPTVEGAKAIVAAKMDKYSAQLLAATLDKTKSIADLSFEMRFNYSARIPALDGKIVIDWLKVAEAFDSLYTNKTQRTDDCGFLCQSHTLTYEEYETGYNASIAKEGIKFQMNTGGRTAAEQEAVAKYTEIFMSMFANLIAEKDDKPNIEIDQAEREKQIAEKNAKIKESAAGVHNYKINISKMKKNMASGYKTVELKLGMNSTFAATVSGNLLEWYNAVKDNKKCVYAVNLNDPFFEHRYINFILDLDAKDIFENEVNYVTVNVRKQRDKGNSFQDRFVIDKKYLTEKGVNSTITYARGEDTNPDVYEYQTQWSLRGGNVFPPVPLWNKGDWAGVTLYPPVKPMNIEFEANLDELKEAGITRVTLQVRYKKFGEEIEDNIHLSPVSGQALTNKILFADKDTRGYVYRMVFNHKEEGKLALDWSAKINDNYVYATIPDGLKDKTSALFKQAKKIGAEMKAKDGKVPSTETIIDGFKSIFDALKK